MSCESKTFHYDIVISLDSNRYMYDLCERYVSKLNGQKYLATTFNHRGYNLYEKNLIKSLIDQYNFDHLMFSLRPSAFNFLKQIPDFNFNEFKDISQVIFLLQSMSRYNIQLGIVSNRHLNFPKDSEEIDAIELYNYVKSYLENFEKIIIEHNFLKLNIKKIFCSLLSLNKVKNNLNGRKIKLLENLIDFENILGNESFVFEQQISELEKDIFWIGFDSKFKEVPWDKDYPKTKWNHIIEKSPYGEPLYGNSLRYCTRCCMPETMEGMKFDEFGVCTPCRSSEEKMHINWEDKEKSLKEILAKCSSNDYYDCMLPMSGGKDSTFQAYILSERYKVNPIAVTHGANWMSLTGRYNLENCLQKFDLDHLIFHANRNIINKAAAKSLKSIGDACWHCHIGAGTFPIQTAFYWNVGIMIWGESIAERDGRGAYFNQSEASLQYHLEVSAKIKAEDFTSENIAKSELTHWFYPEESYLKNENVRYLHLGNFIFWDEEKQVEFLVRNYEWMDSKVENAYKGYKSTECIMAGVHDYANFIKRGIGRSTNFASDDVRRGIITREEGFELAKKYDSQRPHALDYYLEITGYSEEEFENELIKARSISKYASKLNNK
jgi:N-acetyl sugar amidotransferase